MKNLLLILSLLLTLPASSIANEVLIITDKEECVAFTDADFDRWKSMGVDGFICNVRHLRSFGGTQSFTGDPAANLSGTEYKTQREFRDGNVAARAKAKGLSMYLNFWLANYWNAATPLVEWFDDARWASVAIPRIRDFAGAAKLLGVAGISYDSELYTQSGERESATWQWNYPGNTRTEAQVRAKVKQRGAQVMQAILAGFPNVEIIAYNSYLPEGSEDIIQTIVNKAPGSSFRGYTHIDFIDGLTSVNGYAAFNLSTQTFYKECYYSYFPCDNVLQEHANTLYSLLSRRLSNWEYASQRFFDPSFIWIDGANSSGWAAPRSVAHVSKQLVGFKKFGSGGKLLIFDYNWLTFDYTPYASALRQAGTPEVSANLAPTLVITSPMSGNFQTTSNKLSLAGHAKDDLAIKAVRWSNDRGGSGAAPTNWQVFSKYGHASFISYYQTPWDWQTSFSTEIALQPGLNKITVEAQDIHGLKTAQVLNVVSATASPPPPPPPSPPGLLPLPLIGNLLGHWKFDEGSGTSAADSSANKNTGTLVNGPLWSTGKMGRALSFGGSNGYVRIPDKPGLEPGQDVTLAAWVYLTAFNPPGYHSGIIYKPGKKYGCCFQPAYGLGISAYGYLFFALGDDSTYAVLYGPKIPLNTIPGCISRPYEEKVR